MAVEKYQFERVLLALNWLAGPGYIKRESFMEECRISDRTFDRLIADMRFYVPLKYSELRQRYEVDRTRVSERTQMLDDYKKLLQKDDFLLFYAFVRSMIKSKYFFPPLKTEYGTSAQLKDFAKVLKVLEELVLPVDKKVCDRIEYYLSGHYHFRSRPHYKEVMEKIMDSFKIEQLMSFSYFGKIIIAEPLKLVYYNGKWYLIAYLSETDGTDEKKCGAVRTYKLAYVKNAQLLKGRYFTIHEEPEYSFTESFGMFMDEDVKEAVIHLYGTAAEDAMEIVWHENQFTRQLFDKKKGKYAQIKLLYPEKGSVELIARVLSFGIKAEVISPPELKDQWLEQISGMYQSYAKKK